jgi:hypothetical protein
MRSKSGARLLANCGFTVTDQMRSSDAFFQ